ncbi:MAG: hypothetical protein HND53_13465 [Proteobacteria bacterium]|nr:hypothetical protein [Pseudomonadota bacterium]NOG61506.1 hypothetical protein [Pseudomonadota bacterium]
MKSTQNALALVAVLFGLVTVFVGTRVLLGSDPGYIVYRPLLFYNTVMGIAYVSAGIIALRNVKQGMYIAAVIFSLNLIVLIAIYYLYTGGSPIAINSLRAMTLRTVVWLALFIGFRWLSYRNIRQGFN